MMIDTERLRELADIRRFALGVRTQPMIDGNGNQCRARAPSLAPAVREQEKRCRIRPAGDREQNAAAMF
jgi:hypothetical protein